jgi:hypothetical protein
VGDIGERLGKATRSLKWLPAYGWQRLTRRLPQAGPVHLIVAIADHFEPSILPQAVHLHAGIDEQIRRLERWCREYPQAMEPYLDSDHCRFRHTYFFPAEQAERRIIELLVEHCRDGWGEIEIHLHHGIDGPDTGERTRRLLEGFRDLLATLGCLSRWDGAGPPRYAFVHGNWALANSARGRYCGVDEEMQILADTGCYADFTLPSAPSPAQVSKINALYECGVPLSRRAPHRRGRDLRRGSPPRTFPLIVEGPLGLDFESNGHWSARPRIENSEITTRHPPTLRRLELWKRAAIRVQGRPDWLFLKLHCHGMDPRDENAMIGPAMAGFLRDLLEDSRRRGDSVHFVTARELTNIVLAACDGKEGNPGSYRDYRLLPAVRAAWAEGAR